MSKLTWSWSVESEPQRSRNLLARDVRLRCRRNQTGTVGSGEANCGETQLRTRAHLGKRNHQERTPQSFYDLPTNACSYGGQGTPASGIRSAARSAGFRPFRTGCTIYLVSLLDAKQLLSASIDRVRNNRTTKSLKLAARVKAAPSAASSRLSLSRLTEYPIRLAVSNVEGAKKHPLRELLRRQETE
jgi:hypothetical protein